MTKLKLLQKYQNKNFDTKTNKVDRDKLQLIRMLVHQNVLNEEVLLSITNWFGKKIGYYTNLGEKRGKQLAREK